MREIQYFYAVMRLEMVGSRKRRLGLVEFGSIWLDGDSQSDTTSSTTSTTNQTTTQYTNYVRRRITYNNNGSNTSITR